MEREQVVKALECWTSSAKMENLSCEGCYFETKGLCEQLCTMDLADVALALINELIEENEGLEDNLIKQSTENIMLLIERQEIKADTVRRMQSDIQEACLKGGIWPAFVAGVVKGVGEKILEENNV